jgi:hypothetical protein
MPIGLSRKRRILRTDIGPGAGRGAQARAVSVELDVERRLLRRRAAALSSNLCSLKATAEGAGYRNQDAGSDKPSD